MPTIMGNWMERTRAAGLTPVTVAYGDTALHTADIYRPAGGGSGFAIFYHGGYWRSCSRHEHGWVAQAYLDQGMSVAIMDYPLCPDSDLAEIVAATVAAFVFLHRSVMTEAERAHVIVAGHSAGGHLAAFHRTIDWQQHGLPARPLHGISALSGIFDLDPLRHTLMNDWLCLTPQSAEALSVANKPAVFDVPTVLAVGELESSEFHRQSRVLAERWPDTTYRSIAGRHHFDVMDALLTDRALAAPV